jgi:hypothetical protein
MLEGRRGPNVIGKPVYDGAFRDEHVSESLALNPTYPLITVFDFGHSFPACVFAQYLEHSDQLVVLGAVQGKDVDRGGRTWDSAVASSPPRNSVVWPPEEPM